MVVIAEDKVAHLTVRDHGRFSVRYNAGWREEAGRTSSHVLAVGELQCNLLKYLDKDSKLIVYCKTGRGSNVSIQILKQMGFTNPVNGIYVDHVTKISSSKHIRG